MISAIEKETLSKYFMGADLQELIRTSFKREPTKFDFKVASKMASLFMTLPASHGLSSIVKTLLGRAKMTKKADGYGMVAGMKEYGAKRIETLCAAMETFLIERDVLRFDNHRPPASVNDAPEWLAMRRTSDLEVLTLAGYMEMLGEEYGIDVPVPVQLAECTLTIKEAKKLFVEPIKDKVNEALVKFLMTECKKPAVLVWTSDYDSKAKQADGSATFVFCFDFADIGDLYERCPLGNRYRTQRIRLRLHVSADNQLLEWKVVFKDKAKDITLKSPATPFGAASVIKNNPEAVNVKYITPYVNVSNVESLVKTHGVK